jgi:hypothetical protein
MGLTFGKTVDNYTQWLDGPKLPAPKRRKSKSRSSSSYKSAKSHPGPTLPYKSNEKVYGLKKKKNKEKEKKKHSDKKRNLTKRT